MSAIKHHHHAAIEAARHTTERPILFSTDMVRAILDGRKNQTRRIVKPNTADWFRTLSSIAAASAPQNKFCPYGYPGDRLYVRETWGKFGEATFFKADNPNAEGVAWKPSIHMPRAASRLTLQITNIRAQRLHDITEADAIAEGLNFIVPNSGPNTYYDNYLTGRWIDPEMLNNPIASYRTLWEKINGPHSWDANPWVWAITFKVL